MLAARMAMVVGCMLAGARGAAGVVPQPHGLPFIRSYPLDEIGNAPRSLRLGFDTFGRLAVTYDGVYAVLNDSVWVDRIDRSLSSRVRMSTIQVADGQYYYGGRGSWGTAVMTPDGRLQAAPLVPVDAPEWTRVTAFNGIFATTRGVCFFDTKGVVFWDRVARQNRFYEMPWLSTVFPVGDRVFVSAANEVLRELLPESGASRVVTRTGIDGRGVALGVALDRNRTLLTLFDGQLMVFDGEVATPWGPQIEHEIEGQVTAMRRLVEGGVAIAVANRGIYLFSEAGQLMGSLLLPEFRRISELAAGEKGVIWAVSENAVHRIFYDSPLTGFGQQLGLTTTWPVVVDWNDRVVICSGGSLYESEPVEQGHLPTFRIVTDKNTRRADVIASRGDHLLVGNQSEVYAVAPDGTLSALIQIANVGGLEFIGPDTCLVIGSREIAALRYADGRWSECAPRIRGVGDAPMRTQVHGALWIELGGNQVARVKLWDDGLHLDRIELPWRDEQWTNVGVIGDRIVLSGAIGHRTYYDESTERLCDAPDLDALLSRSPYWILRIKKDEAGILWATHARGVVTFTPKGDDYVMDAVTFELHNDSYPWVHILPGNDRWIGAARSLYHVERASASQREGPAVQLVSLVCEPSNLELVDQHGVMNALPRFSYGQSSLTFRFFSGTYAWRSPPAYEYRLGPSEAWTSVDPSLVLRFRQLRESTYHLQVRRAGPHNPATRPFDFAFIVEPPWYRTLTFYALCGLAVMLGLLVNVRWTNQRSRARNGALEILVHERTKELETTMERLAEETSNAATHAERSRLANEIHDSVQQGLSGTILHLETTMEHPSLAPEMRAQLDVMRKMLSYSREEVQQAVWNLESPLLQNSTLGEALRTLASFIHTGSVELKVLVPAEPLSLEPTIQHNLLRIAQEAITNAVKHAGSHRIVVTLESRPDAVVLDVTDDGAGFDLSTCSHLQGHFGLRGIRSRAKAIKAEFTLHTAPARGTTVRVTVPR